MHPPPDDETCGAPPGGRAAGRASGQGIAHGWDTARSIGRDLAEDVGVVADEARVRLATFRDRTMRPALGEVRVEWQALTEVVAADDTAWGRGARAVFGYLGRAASELSGSLSLLWPQSRVKRLGRRRQAGPLRARSLRQSFRAAWALMVSGQRDAQIDEVGGSEARRAIREAEAVVDHYLKAAAVAMAVAAAGVLLYQPLLWIAALLICYVAFPAVKSGYLDLVNTGRLSIRALDAVTFAGLLLGGWVLVCAITAFIFHVSAKLMLKTEDRSRKLIADLFGGQPRTVLRLVDGQEIEIPVERLAAGDLIVVHAGQMIPVDGVISDGTAAVDQHVLTGEAQPAEKAAGDAVFAATVLLAGRIVIRVDKTGAETAAARIRDLLANTVDFREALQARWQMVADHTVLPTLLLTGLAAVFFGPAGALAILCSNYVAVMKIASPLGMLTFLQRAAQSGILVKDGRTLETMGGVDTVVFDKTGTLTLPQPHVGAIHAFTDFPADDVLRLAAAVEAHQSHPIALAILEEAQRRAQALPAIEDARYDVGYGVRATVDGRRVCVGSARLMAMEGIELPPQIRDVLGLAQLRGTSVIYAAVDRQAIGAIELRPTLRPDAREVTATLAGGGLDLFIVSGDQAAPTEALAAELGISRYFADVLPQDKSQLVERLQQEGRRVCFVGDGINDAIALKAASVSVSLRGASSLAVNTAQVILMDQRLGQLAHLFDLARDYEANLRTLLITTFLPGVVSMAGVFFLGTRAGIALLLYNVSMVAGLLNAVWPAAQSLPLETPRIPPAPQSAEAGR